ncbi:hypothetical protein BKA62DRAFT_785394 [Auriculariales sp. MPI-PUGE-AT-0066]|nr:hypothetical protein BKA62DRAFT_785394 [Auriculariales sp. MPI-PUGE-AT-0066]
MSNSVNKSQMVSASRVRTSLKYCICAAKRLLRSSAKESFGAMKLRMKHHGLVTTSGVTLKESTSCLYIYCKICNHTPNTELSFIFSQNIPALTTSRDGTMEPSAGIADVCTASEVRGPRAHTFNDIKLGQHHRHHPHKTDDRIWNVVATPYRSQLPVHTWLAIAQMCFHSHSQPARVLTVNIPIYPPYNLPSLSDMPVSSLRQHDPGSIPDIEVLKGNVGRHLRGSAHRLSQENHGQAGKRKRFDPLASRNLEPIMTEDARMKLLKKWKRGMPLPELLADGTAVMGEFVHDGSGVITRSTPGGIPSTFSAYDLSLPFGGFSTSHPSSFAPTSFNNLPAFASTSSTNLPAFTQPPVHSNPPLEIGPAHLEPYPFYIPTPEEWKALVGDVDNPDIF